MSKCLTLRDAFLHKVIGIEREGGLEGRRQRRERHGSPLADGRVNGRRRAVARRVLFHRRRLSVATSGVAKGGNAVGGGIRLFLGDFRHFRPRSTPEGGVKTPEAERRVAANEKEMEKNERD